VVGFANMYGQLTAQAYALDKERERDTRGVWNLASIWRGVQSYIQGMDEDLLAMWSTHLNS
jgi:hypothetical protein